jgi:hypothetical protein
LVQFRYKLLKRTKDSWLFHSVHIIANNFLPIIRALAIMTESFMHKILKYFVLLFPLSATAMTG